IYGRLSGVAGRKPAQTRIAESDRSAGIYSNALDVIRRKIAVSAVESSTPNCREEPISICPVTRGCKLNATESASLPCADFKYPSSTNWCFAKLGYRSVITRWPFRLLI